MGKNIQIINIRESKVVQIDNIIFKGKQNIDWKAVEIYAKQYIGNVYLNSNDKIYIGNDFPDEYAHSKDTERLRGAAAKAKANAVQGIKELIAIANQPRHTENFEKKHSMDARYGWYRYTTRFSLPVLENNVVFRYNVFIVTLLVRHAADQKKYLYDIVNIKKETEYPA